MKKLSLLLILIITLSTFTFPVYANEDISVYIDGKEITFDTPPMMVNNRVLVPMRAIFEELGMTVEWFNETQTVMAAKQGVVLDFPIGSTTVSRNTVEQTIDVPAQLVGSRTLVPVRFVSEFTGAEVSWDGNTNTVFISSKDNIKQLDWNDTYEYWGEVVNGEATGYGALYNKENGSLRQIGKYIDSKIVAGSDFFANGDTFNGNYENGMHAYGIYCWSDGESFVGEFENGILSNGTYNYSSGDSYEGSFVDGKRHGTGTYYYKDGSFLKGKWENGLPDGYGILYDAVEDVQLQGNFIDGKRDGYFVFDDFDMDTTHYATYVAGEVIYTSTTPYDSTEIYNAYIQNKQIESQKATELEQIETDFDDLYEEYLALNEWLNDEYDELLDYVQNGDPYSTDWAQTIYENFGVGKYSYGSYGSGTGSNGGNIDSFAAANAMRQNAALNAQAKAQADAAIREYNKTYINNWEDQIKTQYNNELSYLENKQQALFNKLTLLQQQYVNEKTYLNTLKENFVKKINALY